MGQSLLVTIESQFTLKGTLTIPTETKERYPAILIIAGTGKTDRDGNDKGIKLGLYKELADFFTSIGFITLRYDKRGTHKSDGDYYAAGVQDLIDDAAACIRFLKSDKRVDSERILIAGHSEGALLAPAVHRQAPVSGMILLAGGAEPSKELLPKQFEMAVKEIREMTGFKGLLFRVLKAEKKAKKQQNTILKKIMNSDEAVIRYKGTKINAKWMREQIEYNVCDYLLHADCPVLAITGDKDIQVPPQHAKRIAEMVPGKSDWHIIADMNHILRKYSGKHTMLGLMREYKSLFHQPIDRDLLTILEQWLKENFA